MTDFIQYFYFVWMKSEVKRFFNEINFSSHCFAFTAVFPIYMLKVLFYLSNEMQGEDES